MNQPIIPELPSNPDKLQKLVALKELMLRVKDRDASAFNYSTHIRHKKDISNDKPIYQDLKCETDIINYCGSPACVAGWSVLLDPTILDDEDTQFDFWLDVKLRQTDFLELTDMEADFLFMGNEYFDENGVSIYPDVYKGKGSWFSLAQVSIDEAIDRLSFLIKMTE
jgi:hypothetical protein